MEIIHDEHLYAYYITWAFLYENRSDTKFDDDEHPVTNYIYTVKSLLMSTNCIINEEDEEEDSELIFIYHKYCKNYAEDKLKRYLGSDYIDNKKTRHLIRDIAKAIRKKSYNHKEFIHPVCL